MYNGCTINFKNPNSFFAITNSLSKFSINGDKGIPNSVSILDWFINSLFTKLLHSLQTSNYFVDAPKSLECINIPQRIFSSSKSSFLKLFFFSSYFLRTLKCSFMSVFKMFDINNFRNLTFSSLVKKSKKSHYLFFNISNVREIW